MKIVGVTGLISVKILYLANCGFISSIKTVGAPGLGGLWALEVLGGLWALGLRGTFLKQTCAAQESQEFALRRNLRNLMLFA